MAKKLSQEERERVQLHRKVAPGIPQKRQYKSIEGQKYIEFNHSFTVREEKAKQKETIARQKEVSALLDGLETMIEIAHILIGNINNPSSVETLRGLERHARNADTLATSVRGYSVLEEGWVAKYPY